MKSFRIAYYTFRRLIIYPQRINLLFKKIIIICLITPYTQVFQNSLMLVAAQLLSRLQPKLAPLPLPVRAVLVVTRLLATTDPFFVVCLFCLISFTCVLLYVLNGLPYLKYVYPPLFCARLCALGRGDIFLDLAPCVVGGPHYWPRPVFWACYFFLPH
jgi:hypothetical protein